MKTNENLRSDRRHRSAYQWRRFHALSCLICSTCLRVYTSGRSYRVAASRSSVCIQALFIQHCLPECAPRGLMDTSVVAEAELLGFTPTFQPQGHRARVCMWTFEQPIISDCGYNLRNINSERCCRADEQGEVLNGFTADPTESWSAGFTNEALVDQQRSRTALNHIQAKVWKRKVRSRDLEVQNGSALFNAAFVRNTCSVIITLTFPEAQPRIFFFFISTPLRTCSLVPLAAMSHIDFRQCLSDWTRHLADRKWQEDAWWRGNATNKQGKVQISSKCWQLDQYWASRGQIVRMWKRWKTTCSAAFCIH